MLGRKEMSIGEAIQSLTDVVERVFGSQDASISERSTVLVEEMKQWMGDGEALLYEDLKCPV